MDSEDKYIVSILEIDDDLGFIIPSPILKSLNIKDGDILDFELSDGCIS